MGDPTKWLATATLVVVIARLLAAIAVVGGVLGGVSYAAGVTHTATVGTLAERDAGFSAAATCDLATVQALAARHPTVRQWIVMQTSAPTAASGTVEVAVRTKSGTWKCQRGAQPARFGRAGTRPLLDRISGDDTTPAGVFPLGRVTAWDGGVFSIFGNRPDPGVLANYRNVRAEDCWGATKNTARYQHLVNRPNCAGPDDEWLRGVGDVYAHAAVIGANLDPISGDEPGETPHAAAIFLHRNSYNADGSTKGTSGCVSLGYDDLVATLRIIDPALSPHFAIGPTNYLRNTA